jgi:hypothetical protein
MITFRKNSKEVVMIGSEINNESLESVEVPEDARLKQGYTMFYEDGNVRFEKSEKMLFKEKEENDRLEFFDKVIKAKDAVDKDDKKELKNILETLLKKSYNQ